MKKIKEASHEYFRAAQLGFENPGSEAGFKAGVEFAQRWISVEEELPEKQGYYLVLKTPLFRGNCNVVVAEFHEDNKTFYYQRSYSTIENITHWRPIELK